MLDIMLDLETMGTGPQAAIVAIGAVEFDLEKGILGEEFYETVYLSSSVSCGGIIDADTVLWWMQQSEKARSMFCNTENIDIITALYEFTSWLQKCGDVDKVRLWGCGAAFDNVILASAYRNAAIPVPWKFFNDRCYRTIKSLFPSIKMQRTGTHHNAVDDAKSQAHHLIRINEKIGLI